METDDIRITLRLPREVHQAVTDAAKRADRSLNGQIVQILRLWAENETNKRPVETLA